MKQFEYKIVSLRNRYEDCEVTDPVKVHKAILNRLGEEGYELVAVIGDIAYLKKEAPGLSPAQHREMLTKKVRKTPEGPPLITVPDNMNGELGSLWPWWPFKRHK